MSQPTGRERNARLRVPWKEIRRAAKFYHDSCSDEDAERLREDLDELEDECEVRRVGGEERWYINRERAMEALSRRFGGSEIDETFRN